jgi:aminoglycoside phosphotransferase (APT) family kinase protein
MVDQLDVAKALLDGIDDHPAVLAWARTGAGPAPSEIRILKERSKGIRKSAVYWLRGAGPDGSAVIAKLARRDAAALETLLYRDLLPHTRVGAPRFHGAVDAGEVFTWLFLEHIDGERYTPRRVEHRVAAGTWLGELHAAALEAGRDERLPDRGPDHFLTWVLEARDAMAAAVGYPDMTRDETRVAEQLRKSLDELAARWDEVVRTAALLPSTLVHGDLVRKNLVVRRRAGAFGVVALDWEKGGWGAPALDLAYGEESKSFAANPCLEAYGRALEARGRRVDPEAIRRSAAIGTALRCVSAIVWTAAELSAAWVHRPMAYMTVYGRWLAAVMADAGIGGRRARI